MEKHERCEECGGSNFIFSTEWKKGKWVWKKICKSCENVAEERVLEDWS